MTHWLNEQATPDELLYLKCQAVLGGTERIEQVMTSLDSPEGSPKSYIPPAASSLAVDLEPQPLPTPTSPNPPGPDAASFNPQTPAFEISGDLHPSVSPKLAPAGAGPFEESEDASGNASGNGHVEGHGEGHGVGSGSDVVAGGMSGGVGDGGGMLRVQRPSSAERLAELHAFTAALQSIGTSLSRTEAFQSVLKDTIEMFELDA